MASIVFPVGINHLERVMDLSKKFGKIAGFTMMLSLILLLLPAMAFGQSVVTPPSQTLDAGGQQSLIVLPNGEVWGWGNNFNNQLSLDSRLPYYKPEKSAGISGVSAVSTGEVHTLALVQGKVWSWGSNLSWQLGRSSITSSTPEQVADLSNVVAVSAGANHSLALTSDGKVVAWGGNSNGQLGNNKTDNSYKPVQVLTENPQNKKQLIPLADIIAVSAGDSFSLAVKADGTVWAWGDGSNGQLNGTGNSSKVAIQVIGLADIVQVSAGASHSLALTSKGEVYAWGANNYGQLGDGKTNYGKNKPGKVTGLDNVASIAAGSYHSLALTKSGTVYAWGNNDYGQLGIDSTRDSSKATAVKDLTGVTAISAGSAHSVALKSDGSVWSWGSDLLGQLGNNLPIKSSLVPVRTSLNSDTQAPVWAQNSTLTAKDIKETELLLEWTAATDNTGVTGYKVYQGNSVIGTATTTQFKVTGLKTDTEYTFRVEATDAAGNESKGGPATTAKTLKTDKIAPVTTYHMTKVKSPSGKYTIALIATLTATDEGSGVKVTQYRINRDGGWKTYTGPVTVPAETTFYLEWRSIDNAGNVEKTWFGNFDNGKLYYDGKVYTGGKEQ